MYSKPAYFTLFFLLLIFSVNAQVGVNTTAPGDGSILDVESSEKGLLIPRVNIEDLSTIAPITFTTAAEESLLVYNTNISTGKGFYYWDGSNWVALTIPEDGDFYQVGTSSAPSSISDDVFRTGNVGIGETTPSYPLEITNSSTTRGASIVSNGTASGVIYSLYLNNENTNSGTENRFGVYSRVRIPGTQSNKAYGTWNELTYGSGAGDHFGTYNKLYANVSRDQIGVNNWIYGGASGNGEHIGVINNMTGSGSGTHTGVQNQMKGGSSYLRGVYNLFNIDLDGLHRGMENQITNNGNGEHQGVYTSLSGSGSGDHTGVSNYITSIGNGVKNGVANTISVGTGTGIHRGTYNNISGEGTIYGVENDIDGTATGQIAYGTYNDVNSNYGTNIAGWFDSHGSGGTYYAAIFNRGNVVANEYGADNDFRVETDDDENTLFVNGDTDNVGIGTATPDSSAKLEVNGKIKATDINFSGIPSFANNAAAAAALSSGDVYRVGVELRIVP